MVKKILGKAKDVVFSDPKSLYKDDRDIVKKDFFLQGKNGKAILLLHGWTTKALSLHLITRVQAPAGSISSPGHNRCLSIFIRPKSNMAPVLPTHRPSPAPGPLAVI